MKNEKIALKGQKYATPRTESLEVSNQGVLCGSGGAKGPRIKSLVSGGSL